MAESKAGTYLTKLHLKNVKSFRDEHSLDLCDTEGKVARWTLILGDNGVGKTTLLQCLARLAPYRNTKDPDGTKNPTFLVEPIGAAEVKNIEELGRHGAHVVRIEASYVASGTLDCLPHRLSRPFQTWVEFERRGSKIERFDVSEEADLVKKDVLVIAYGAGRKLGRGNLDPSNMTPPLASIFDDQIELIDAEELIQQLDYAALRRATTKSKRQYDVMIKMIAALLPDIDTPDAIKSHGPSPLNPLQKVGVHVKTPYGDVPLASLSFGYQTMTAWLSDIAFRLFRHYPESANPLLEPAIVLVDEIDLHLHPKWQRQLRERLAAHFPAVQFIATAHSPLMAQSYMSENLAVVRREEDHAVIVNAPAQVAGWRLDQVITSELFGFETPFSLEVERLLDEQRSISTKPSRTVKDEARLAELQEELLNIPRETAPADNEALAIIRRAAALMPQAGAAR